MEFAIRHDEQRRTEARHAYERAKREMERQHGEYISAYRAWLTDMRNVAQVVGEVIHRLRKVMQQQLTVSQLQNLVPPLLHEIIAIHREVEASHEEGESRIIINDCKRIQSEIAALSERVQKSEIPHDVAPNEHILSELDTILGLEQRYQVTLSNAITDAEHNFK